MIAREINARPRKRLLFKSPKLAMEEAA